MDQEKRKGKPKWDREKKERNGEQRRKAQREKGRGEKKRKEKKRKESGYLRELREERGIEKKPENKTEMRIEENKERGG
jgi:hypothetical protein